MLEDEGRNTWCFFVKELGINGENLIGPYGNKTIKKKKEKETNFFIENIFF